MGTTPNNTRMNNRLIRGLENISVMFAESRQVTRSKRGETGNCRHYSQPGRIGQVANSLKVSRILSSPSPEHSLGSNRNGPGKQKSIGHCISRNAKQGIQSVAPANLFSLVPTTRMIIHRDFTKPYATSRQFSSDLRFKTKPILSNR